MDPVSSLPIATAADFSTDLSAPTPTCPQLAALSSKPCHPVSGHKGLMAVQCSPLLQPPDIVQPNLTLPGLPHHHLYGKPCHPVTTGMHAEVQSTK